MGLEIKGLNSLINKLTKLSDIKTDDVVQEVADEIKVDIQERAKQFSDTSYMYIGTSEKRGKGMSCFIDVGLKNEDVPFEKWKNLWFHQWGYFNFGLNFDGEKYINVHQLWFNEAINSVENSAKRKLKEKIKSKVSKALEG